MPICRLCGEDRPLVDAHIIPEAFFRAIRGEVEGPLIVIPNEADEYFRRSWAGIYDDHILCAECDGRIGAWDQHAAELLLQDIHRTWPRLVSLDPDGGEMVTHAYISRDFDYARLKLFAISLLWRASITTQGFFKRIDLRDREAEARAALLAGEPGEEDLYSCLFSIWEARDGLDALIRSAMDPFETPVDGQRSFRFYLGAVMVQIKAGAAPWSEELRSMQLAPDRPLQLLCRDWITSNDVAAVMPAMRRFMEWEMPGAWAKPRGRRPS